MLESVALPPRKGKYLDVIVGWLCALPVLLCVLIMNPRAEIGLHDDWSYIYCAKVLAETGHVTYNGWAAFPVGWLLYAGASMIHLFGFSFTAVRAVNVLLGCFTAPLLYAILQRLGIRRWNAVAGTLTVALCPLFLALTPTFMSDIPALIVFLLCVYGCVRAVQTDTDRGAVAWIVAAALINLLGGTVRQIAWLGVLVMVPTAGWILRRRKGVPTAAAVAWIGSVASIAAFLHWFNSQPYVPIEPLIGVKHIGEGIRYVAISSIDAIYMLVLLLSPILTGIAMRSFQQSTSDRRRNTLTLLIVIAIPFLRPHGHGIQWFSWLSGGGYLNARGLLGLTWFYGPMPDVIPRWLQALVTGFAFSMAALCLLQAWKFRSLWRRTEGNPTTWVTLLFTPFTFAYLLLVFTRANIFDRYFLPLLVVLIVVVLVQWQRQSHRSMSRLLVLPLLPLAAYGVIGSHDLYSLMRARLTAANELRSAGAPRTSIHAGFEYDAWTQLESKGYVNEPRMRNPAGAYIPWRKPAGLPESCVFWFSDYTPDIKARYALSAAPSPCFADAGYPPVRYRMWFPPHDRALYFVEVPSEWRH